MLKDENNTEHHYHIITDKLYWKKKENILHILDKYIEWDHITYSSHLLKPTKQIWIIKWLTDFLGTGQHMKNMDFNPLLTAQYAIKKQNSTACFTMHLYNR